MIRLMRLGGAFLGVALAGLVLVRRWRALEQEIDQL